MGALLESGACACRTGATGCRCSAELEPVSLCGLEEERMLEDSNLPSAWQRLE